MRLDTCVEKFYRAFPDALWNYAPSVFLCVEIYFHQDKDFFRNNSFQVHISTDTSIYIFHHTAGSFCRSEYSFKFLSDLCIAFA